MHYFLSRWIIVQKMPAFSKTVYMLSQKNIDPIVAIHGTILWFQQWDLHLSLFLRKVTSKITNLLFITLKKGYNNFVQPNNTIGWIK